MFGFFNGNGKHAFIGRTVDSRALMPAALETYRALAVALDHTRTGPSGRVLLVTSALPGEGKTLTCANLAMTLGSNLQKRVLVIEGDLRRPTLHKIFGTESIEGANDAGIAVPGGSVPRTFVAVTPTLSVLAATAPLQGDPVQTLGSAETLALIDRARTRYDWVLVDSPPAALVPDPNVLARLADGVLFVIWTANTPFDAIRRGIAAVGKERIIGVVMNRAPSDMDDAAFKYYDRYYDHYSEAGV